MNSGICRVNCEVRIAMGIPESIERFHSSIIPSDLLFLGCIGSLLMNSKMQTKLCHLDAKLYSIAEGQPHGSQ